MLNNSELELQALNNALDSFGLNGYKVYSLPGRKITFLLRDSEGNSITGYWDYVRLNHFIMGYGKAFKKFKEIYL